MTTITLKILDERDEEFVMAILNALVEKDFIKLTASQNPDAIDLGDAL